LVDPERLGAAVRTTARRAGNAIAGCGGGSSAASIIGGGGARLGSSTRIPASVCQAERWMKTASASAMVARKARLGRANVNDREDTTGRIRYRDRSLLNQTQETPDDRSESAGRDAACRIAR
jgi:hypothetical protein